MEKSELVELLRSDVRKWNAWKRNQFSSDQVDLSGAVLRRAKLAGALLGSTDLSRADLRNADLRGANLGPDLYRADLSGAYLSSATLTGSILMRADLSRTDLAGAELDYTLLGSADLRGANLRDAKLNHSDLTRANLDGADLRGATLEDTKLSGTILSNLDVTPFLRARLEISGPVRTDWSTVVKSFKTPNLHNFLVRCGVPAVFATFMIDCARSVSEPELFSLMQSTFISYGGPDEPFARRLQEELERNGVTTFLFSKHAKLGEPVADAMRSGIKDHDRIVVICSKAALDRPGVLNELELIMRREARDSGKALLIPIAIDEYVYSEEWAPENENVRDQVRERVIGNYIGAVEDESVFQALVARLLEVLRLPDFLRKPNRPSG